MKLGIFVSGDGSNLQAIIDAINEFKLIDIEISVVISNNIKSNALNRACNVGIPAYWINEWMIDGLSLGILELYNVDLVILAGYLKKIGPMILKKYVGRIINIHPALLPKYEGMYGDKVHKAVLEAKEKITGVTIHWVNEEYDKGEIISQIEIPVLKMDTVESLKNRVLEVEHNFIVKTLKEIRDKM